jgi:hypothetical protein
MNALSSFGIREAMRSFGLPLALALLAGCAEPPKAPVVTGCDWPETKPIKVGGEVVNPSTLAFTPGLTLFEALRKSGGFTIFARKERLDLRRCGRKDFRLPTPETRGSPNDIVLSPGDVIFVPGGGGDG